MFKLKGVSKMLHYLDGTVFNSPAKTIVNTVNCVGVMGAGLALEFKLRYPEMYQDYKDRCKKNKVKIGRPYVYEYSNDLWILNFPTKKHWRYNSKIEWIETGLKYFAENYKKRDFKSVAFPKLGCNNGGLDWNEVKSLMEHYLINLDIDIYICLNEKQEAEGIEKNMIKKINNAKKEQLIKDIKISSKQAEIIINNLPVKRFWHIKNFEGVGEKSYNKLFTYYYKSSPDNKKTMVQSVFPFS